MWMKEMLYLVITIFSAGEEIWSLYCLWIETNGSSMCKVHTHIHNLDTHTLTGNDLCNVRFQSSYYGLSALLLGTLND